MDYKETLNLPKTEFPMKARLSQREPEILKRWEDEGLYWRIREARKGSPLWVLHDGPPYANGHIHMGHALNKVLKDIINRFKVLEGYDINYVPGWDCHGLPIEHQVEKELGPKKREMSKAEIRRLCRRYAEKYIDIQRDEFKRLGVVGDWEHPYITMDYRYEATILRELGRCFEAGLVEEGLKPVYWCIHCETALAEAEVEYGDHSSPSIYVKFPAVGDLSSLFPQLGSAPAYFVIWTTTPWTLPANLAIAVNPQYTYAAVEVNHRNNTEVWVLAEGLIDEVMAAGGAEDCKVLGTVKGRELEGKRYRHPFEPREGMVILADYVTLVQGSGCVHTAPGHGLEDYISGLQYGLDVYNPVDDQGRLDDTVSHFKGEVVWDANPKVTALLEELGYLIKEEPISHSYPHCWRCKEPVIFRATPQWFICMESKDLRKRCLEAIDHVNWVPAWGRIRIREMVAQRPDWCISRQRAWGVPITVLYCEKCGSAIYDNELFERVAKLVEREGADVWFTATDEEIVPPDFSCPSCGHKGFRRSTDILDVWFDSGVSHTAVLEGREGLKWPCDMYLEGSDQHRGWFQSTLIASVATHDAAPYKEVLTHGFVVDGEGKKMSKSLGNIIAPQEIIQKYGADILRLWVAAEDYSDDVRLSQNIIRGLVDAYRKVRNTIRFMLGNLYDFDPAGDALPWDQMLEMDRWVLCRYRRMVKEVVESYDSYRFHKAFTVLHRFCTIDLSSIYLDVVKERLYICGKDSKERRSVQSALLPMLRGIVTLLSPILVFTAEEAWEFIPGEKEESVHLSRFPEFDKMPHDDGLEERWNRLFELRQEVTKALEEARRNGVIGHPFDATVRVFGGEKVEKMLRGFSPEVLREFFITSQVLYEAEGEGSYLSEEIPGLSITVEKAPGEKCERCWVYSTTVGEDPQHPNICSRCLKVVQ